MASNRMHFVVVVLAALLAGPSWGTVFSCDEAGLDAAIAAAEGGDPGPHSLDCTPESEFAFTGSRTIRADMVLDAQGATARCVEDAVPRGRCRPQTIALIGAAIELRNLTIRAPVVSRLAVMLRASGGDVTLRNVVLLGEDDPFSNGIESSGSPPAGGTLHLIESTVTGFGAGVSISDASHATIERTLITNNAVAGVVLELGATGQLIDSTVSGNGGSGVVNGGMLTIVHSTLTANDGFDYSDSALIQCGPPPRPSLLLPFSAGHATTTNSIIGGSCAPIGVPPPPPGEIPPFCSPIPPPGTMTSTGGNMESPGDTCQLTDPTDQVNIAAAELALGPLQDNGGPTNTHALLEGSVAIDAADLGDCTLTDQRGIERPQGAGCDAGAYEAEVLEVAIDIKPGNDLNPINPTNRGVIPVAILGSDTFDVADVDVTSLAFGPNGAALAHRNGPHLKDGNHDGLDDLLAHFLTEESGIAFGDEEACVTGETLDGAPFEGCDAIATEPPCGRGYEAALLLPPLLWAGRRPRRRAACHVGHDSMPQI